MAFSQFGTNSAARRKRVFYTETGTTIREGMPVCYEFDATANVLHYDKGAGGDAASQSSPTTTAEGNLNEGKFMRVEDPDDDNIHAFAGVVAGASYAGLAGGRWLDIYVPNGAVVPVRCDQNCVVGRTILAVNVDESILTAPHGAARAVAVAIETVDRSAGATTTPGLVLAKLDTGMFLFQEGDGAALLVDDVDTAWQQVNKIKLASAGSQWLEAMYVSLDFLAAGTNTGLGLNVDLNVYQTACVAGMASSAIQGSVYFQSGFVSTGGNFRAVSAKLKDEATLDLSGCTIACLYLEHYIRAASTGPAISTMIQCNATAGTNKPNFLFYGQNNESLAYIPGNDTGATKLGDIAIATPTMTGWIRVYDGRS